tara:strand:+ start:3812 stop:4738 length:927 start_codon:yes stop_codon:yes gene_type:complete
MNRSIREIDNIDIDQTTISEAINGRITYYMYVETFDGLYTPIGIELPQGEGPFPLVLMASGNGGGAMRWLKENIRNRRYTMEKLLAQGIACGWIRYRAEVDLGYHEGGTLVRDSRQGGDMFNRSPLEYEDEIAIIEYLKTYQEIDESRIGLLGMSHAGEMILKITSEYQGICAAVASEPAAHEFLALTPDHTVTINNETQLRDIESMQMQSVDKVRARIDEKLALNRISSIETPIFIMGRDQDELQGIFRLSYDLLKESGKDVQWKSYEHDLHGYIYPLMGDDGKYIVDSVQEEAISDMLNFFNKYFN